MKLRQPVWKTLLSMSIGIGFLIIAIMEFYENWGHNIYPAIGMLIFSIGWILMIYFFHRRGYLQITETEIIRPGFLKDQKINIKDLNQLKFKDGDYIFSGRYGKIQIIREMIDKRDLSQFEDIFQELKNKI